MQQRLGIGVALLGDPALVILDEPTSALDPIGRMDVRGILRAARDRGAAVLLNSHLLTEVEQVCDRPAIVDRGAVAAEGPLASVLGARETRIRVEGLEPPGLAALARLGQPRFDGRAPVPIRGCRQPRYRKQPGRWSSTSPTLCMNA